MPNDPGYPAFAAWSPEDTQSGLSSRAYYAAAALPGVIAAYPNSSPKGIAKVAFDVADAMIKKEFENAENP